MTARETLAQALGLDPADVAGWPPEVARDHADGRALRLLREALPTGDWFSVWSPTRDQAGSMWAVTVRATAGAPVGPTVTARTLGDAIDGCLAALGSRP